jgi:hypothetical protein
VRDESADAELIPRLQELVPRYLGAGHRDAHRDRPRCLRSESRLPNGSARGRGSDLRRLPRCVGAAPENDGIRRGGHCSGQFFTRSGGAPSAALNLAREAEHTRPTVPRHEVGSEERDLQSR